MANTFLAAQGKNMQKSRVEEDKLALARTILAKAPRQGRRGAPAGRRGRRAGLDAIAGETVAVDAMPEGTMALDVGPKTVALFGQGRRDAPRRCSGTGPMGLFETPAFSKGTLELAADHERGAGLHRRRRRRQRGGGQAWPARTWRQGFKHISTGGGASLELIEGKKLPGVEALRDRGGRPDVNTDRRARSSRATGR